MSKQDDKSFEDVRIKSVRAEGKDGWGIEREDGWSFFVPAKSPVTPAPGMILRFYGRGIGFPVRGLDIEGQEVFYESEADYDARFHRELAEKDRERRYDFEKNRAAMDARYRALPDFFQRRLDKFRANNPDFRWQFEGYEMFCCEQAVEIANAMLAKAKAETPAARMTFEQTAAVYVKHFSKLEYEEQKKAVPKLSDGHSGNTFGCAVSLAYQYLACPENVVKIHGAMAAVVGSEEYGCVPRKVKASAQ